MRPLDEIAVVAPESSVFDAMWAITKAGVGAACVVEEERLVVDAGAEGASAKDRDVLAQWGRRARLASGEDAVERGV